MDLSILQEQANTLRFLSADTVQKANSGHPGAPLGMADILTILGYHLSHNPENSTWLNRDRLVFSGGRTSALPYSFLHLSGYNLGLDDIKNFRQLHSKTPGRPEISTQEVEIATGPSGQGIANAVGFAIAAKKAQNLLGKELINHKVYCLCGDRGLQEGISYEACSLAGLHELDNLIIIYDSNEISIEGDISLTFNEDVKIRFESQGFEVLSIDGHNYEAIDKALKQAKKANKPCLIIAKTIIAKGVGEFEGSYKSHGAPLGEEVIKKAKEKAGFDPNLNFYISKTAKIRFESTAEPGDLKEAKWKDKLEKSEKEELLEKPLDPNSNKINYPDSKGKNLAMRDSSGGILNALAKNLEGFLGGSADLAPSNKTELYGMGDFTEGKNIHFSVKEHAIAAINNAFARYGIFLPFSATFFIFSEYLKPVARIVTLMEVKHSFILTHDSIGVGEDGPTHQPIEQLSTFRAMPNFLTFRPANEVENIKAWQIVLNADIPSTFVLSRQKLKALNGPVFGGVKNGVYLLKESKDAKFTLLASGSEVSLCLESANELEKQGFACNVTSMPCFELFEEQDKVYKDRLLQGEVIGVEAAHSNELYKFCDRVYGIESFRESGKDRDIFEHFGFSAPQILSFILDR